MAAGTGVLHLLGLLLLLLAAPVLGFGRNPYEEGCLYSKNITRKIRVCNSDDDPNSKACRRPQMDYAEVRLIPQDWESVMFSTWIIQVLLSEVLDVPTTIETGDSKSQLNFYHPNSPWDYPSLASFMDALENTAAVDGDCSKAGENHPDGYLSCGHFVAEVWGGRKRDIQDMVQRQIIEPPVTVGQLAQEGWFVPRHTALRDPTLLSYLGYQGEDNRRKMAETFLRPTTWYDYCTQVSPNNCLRPDGVATRPPLQTLDEYDKMFAEGLYTGHFRLTDKANCTKYPTTCTGHFTDYPCDWRSPVPGQLHHLGIALDAELDAGGYTYSQLIEIYRAANATKSDVVMFWWTPQLLYSEFQLTDSAFTRVALPAASQDCIEARVDTKYHCSPDLEKRFGSPENACMEPPNSLTSILSSYTYKRAYESSDSRPLKEAEYSPSHEALTNYRLSELQIEEIMIDWNEVGNPREALCNWVADNMEYLEAFIPRHYPRSFVQKADAGPLLYASTFIGAICMMVVFITFIAVMQHKHRTAIMHAQIEFLQLLLLGALFISLGAIIMGAPSSNASCIIEVWLVNIGYTLELVPLIIKISAVLHVMNSGKRMKRVRIQREMLFGAVAGICTLMVVYLSVWTALDPPQVQPEYEVTDQKNDDGNTIVWVRNVCSSKSNSWSYAMVGWNAFLLLVTTVLAIRMRKVNVKGFCETSTLALLVYSHFFFVILRVLTYVFAAGSQYAVAYYRSIAFSSDTMATIVIYFVPKFLASEDSRPSLGSGGSRISGMASIERSEAFQSSVVSEIIQSRRELLALESRASVTNGEKHNEALRSSGGSETIQSKLVRFQEPSAASGLSAMSTSEQDQRSAETGSVDIYSGPSFFRRDARPEQNPNRFSWWTRRRQQRGEAGDEDTAMLRQKIEELQEKNASLEEENDEKTLRLYALEEQLALLKKEECPLEIGEEGRENSTDRSV